MFVGNVVLPNVQVITSMFPLFSLNEFLRNTARRVGYTWRVHIHFAQTFLLVDACIVPKADAWPIDQLTIVSGERVGIDVSASCLHL